MRRKLLIQTLILSILTFSFSMLVWAADEGVLDSIRISMPNGELPAYTSPEVSKLKEMVTRMKSSPTYYLGVIGTFSKATWKRSTKKVSIALNGGISANRGGDVIAKLLEECGLSESEMVSRVRFIPLSGETNDREPFIRVSLVEDHALRDFIALEIKEGLPKETALVSSLILPIVQGKLTGISDENRAVLQDWVNTANTQDDAKVLVFAATPEAGETAKTLLGGIGLEKAPVMIPYQAQTQTDPANLPVTIFLARDLRGDLLSAPSPGAPVPGAGDTETRHTKKHDHVSLIVGASINWSGNWDRHLTPGIDRTNVFPTADVGLEMNHRAALFCKVQLPGTVFENDGGEVNLSEIKLIVRAFGPLCASVSREQYVSRHTARHASVPNYELVFFEKAPGWALGLHADLNRRGIGKGVGVGANVMFVDREYRIPPRWTIQENGDVQAHVYVSYGVSLFRLGGR